MDGPACAAEGSRRQAGSLGGERAGGGEPPCERAWDVEMGGLTPPPLPTNVAVEVSFVTFARQLCREPWVSGWVWTLAVF